MATPANPLGAGSAPASFDSALDAAFDKSSPGSEDTSTETDVTDAPVEPAEVEADPVVEPEPEPDAPAEPEPVSEEEVDPYEEIQPDKVTDNGRTLHFTKQKASLMLAARDFERKVQEVVPGATPEVLAKHYEDSVYAEKMMGDFDSGDPARIDNFVNFWFGQNANPRSVETFAASFVPRIQHAAPKVYEQIERQAMSGMAQRYYEEGLRTKNPDLFALAQNMDYALTGKHLTEKDFQARDPYAEERQRFEQRVAAFEAQQKQTQQQGIQQRASALSRSMDSFKTEEITAGLKSVEAQFKDTPQWNHMQRDLAEKVEAAIAANRPWQTQYDNLKARAIQDTSGKAESELKAMMKGLVSRVVGIHRKGVIDAVTQRTLSANKSAHQVAQAAASRREPNGGQAPVSRTSHSQKLQSAKTFDDAWAVSSSRLK